tara:strand:- start:445 stop:642 length:198 start_codon:yes stop_codon:yes gene_type:complete
VNINKDFAEIVHNSLWDVDEQGDDILLENNLREPKIYTDQLPPMVFPFGYMIVSSTFAYFEEEEE